MQTAAEVLLQVAHPISGGGIRGEVPETYPTGI